jgi:RNA polymerase sigma factor (sigma-70 family)
MASSALGQVLRQIHRLFDSGTVAGQSDAELLARFAATRDEAAFEALVARHGPIVLAVCRSVLHDEHDAEDAFQATFLTLARKAGSLWVGDSLAGWLHRVARRAAIEADAARRRRRSKEKQAAMSRLEAPPREETCADWIPLLHAEIDRLPEKHRAPIVLCDLQALTLEQAAEALRWTVPTLRYRLNQARGRLRFRLERRGITEAGAVLGALALSSSDAARAAVPADLLRATVAAAIGSAPASAAAAALAAALLRSLLAARIKAIATLAVGLIGLVGLASLAAASLGDEGPPSLPLTAKRAVAPAPKPAPAQAAEPPTVRLTGRVVDHEGKPIAEASVRVFSDGVIGRPTMVEATCERDGQFVLGVPQEALRNYQGYVPGAALSAWAPGFCVAGLTLDDRRDYLHPVTIRLSRDDQPVQGRVVDAQGRPVPGARVRVQRITIPQGNDVKSWLERARTDLSGAFFEASGSIGQPNLPHLTAVSGPDGSFEFRGIGRNRIAQLGFQATNFTNCSLFVATAPVPRSSIDDANTNRPIGSYFSRSKFELTLDPTRPIIGVVRDKDTGQPIRDLHITGAAVWGRSTADYVDNAETTTDERGAYRLTGLPSAPSYKLFLDGLPRAYIGNYFTASATHDTTDPLTFDITLKRGILVTGRLTDQASGRPVVGQVQYHALEDNPHTRDFANFPPGIPLTSEMKPSGEFQLPVLPGHGLLAVKVIDSGYIAADLSPSLQRLVKDGKLPIVPQPLNVWEYELYHEINPKPGTRTLNVDLQVLPGRTTSGRIIDAEGRPIRPALARGLDSYQDIEMRRYSGPDRFTVRGIDPRWPRRVAFLDPERKLSGTVLVRGNEPGPVTVRLLRWGAVTARVVDEQGKPLGSTSQVDRHLWFPDADDDNEHGDLFATDPDPDPPGRTGVSKNTTLDKDGRFRVEGLVPGLKYSVTVAESSNETDQPNMKILGTLFEDLQVEPGQTRDLGDVTIRPARP